MKLPGDYSPEMTREQKIDECVRGAIYRGGWDLVLMQKYVPFSEFVVLVRMLFRDSMR